MNSIHSTILVLAAFATTLLPSTTATARQTQIPGMEVPVPDAQIAGAGLKVEWFSQVPIGASDRMIDWELIVDENQSTTSFEVTAGDRREIIWETDRNAFGDAYGVEGARNQANVRKDVIAAEQKFEGVENPTVEVKEYTRPRATIYAITKSGETTAIDADSGKIRWLVQLGDRNLPSVGLGANKKYVAAVNGSTVYCLSSDTGKVLWSHSCKYAVGASPAVTNDRIVVPLANGRLQVLGIKEKGVGSFTLVALGEGTAQPLVTERSVSWPTTRGELNVMMNGQSRNMISYRLRADAAIVSSATSADGLLYVGSLDGHLYAVDESRGSVAWEVSLGEAITQSPVALAGSIYVISDDHKLYKLNAKTGRFADGWNKPFLDVARIVGAGKNIIYVMNRNSQLVGIDRNTKTQLSATRIGSINMVLNNDQSDRLYVGNHRGMIQCLREISSDRAFFHGDEVAVATTPTEDDPMEDEEKPAATEATNPFARAGKREDKNAAEEVSTNDPFAVEASEEDPFAVDSLAVDSPADGSPADDTADEPMAEAEDPFAVEPSTEDPFAN